MIIRLPIRLLLASAMSIGLFACVGILVMTWLPIASRTDLLLAHAAMIALSSWIGMVFAGIDMAIAVRLLVFATSGLKGSVTGLMFACLLIVVVGRVRFTVISMVLISIAMIWLSDATSVFFLRRRL